MTRAVEMERCGWNQKLGSDDDGGLTQVSMYGGGQVGGRGRQEEGQETLSGHDLVGAYDNAI